MPRLSPPLVRIWLALAAAGLFLAAFIYNLAVGKTGNEHFFLNLGIEAAAIALLLFWYRDARATDADNERFLQFLADAKNRRAIQQGGTDFDGVLLHPETPVRQVRMCMSFLIVSVESRSRFLIERSIAQRTALFYAAATLLFGWWAIPWGPYRTFATLWDIARGGDRATVGDLIALIERFPQGPISLPTRVTPRQGFAASLQRGVTLAIGLVASLVAVTIFILWLQRDNQIFIDNTTDHVVHVAVDGKDLGDLSPGAFLQQPLDCGSHRITLRDPSGKEVQDAFTVPARRDPLISVRGVYDIGGRGRYALVTQCYGPDCRDEQSVVEPFSPQSNGRYLPFPNEVHRALDAAIPARYSGSAARNTLTLLGHVRVDGSVGCPSPSS